MQDSRFVRQFREIKDVQQCSCLFHGKAFFEVRYGRGDALFHEFQCVDCTHNGIMRRERSTVRSVARCNPTEKWSNDTPVHPHKLAFDEDHVVESHVEDCYVVTKSDSPMVRSGIGAIRLFKPTMSCMMLVCNSNVETTRSAMHLLMRNAPIKHLAIEFNSPTRCMRQLALAITECSSLVRLSLVYAHWVLDHDLYQSVVEFASAVRRTKSLETVDAWITWNQVHEPPMVHEALRHARIARLFLVMMRPSRNAAFEKFKRRDGDHAILLGVREFLFGNTP